MDIVKGWIKVDSKRVANTMVCVADRSDIRFAAEIDTALENVGINPKDKVLYRINVWTEKTPKNK